MATLLHRGTLELLRSVNTPDYIPGYDKTDPQTWGSDYIVGPDLSAVEGWPQRYWKLDGDSVVLMDEAERAAVDAAETEAAEQARKAAEIARLDSDPMLLALIAFEAQKSGEDPATIKAALIAAIQNAEVGNG